MANKARKCESDIFYKLIALLRLAGRRGVFFLPKRIGAENFYGGVL
jgi:hypothetical protein